MVLLVVVVVLLVVVVVVLACCCCCCCRCLMRRPACLRLFCLVLRFLRLELYRGKKGQYVTNNQ